MTAAADATIRPLSTSEASAPPARPEFAATGSGPVPVCVTYDDASAVPRLSVGGELPPAGSTVPTTGRTGAGLPQADRIQVPAGRAALVEAMPSSEAAAGTLVLVTDQGRGHALAGPEILAVLGYGRARPVRLPAGLVARIPHGAGLDPSAARRPATEDVAGSGQRP